jgi:hypothetical protein
MVDLALRHYPVFVAASTHHTKIITELEKCKNATDSIVAGVQGLQSNYDEFVGKANEWKKARGEFGNLVTQQGKLQELLEAPQLLDTCFRNEMFHEAILVLQHMRTLVEAHSTLPLITRIAAEVDDIVNTNVVHLVQKLSSPALPIPLCINIVSLLKRLGVCSDRELRYVFLSRRFAYIDTAITEARALSTTPYSYIGKLMSVLKMQLCEVVTQYETCFPPTTDTHRRLSAHDSELDVPCADPMYSYVLRIVIHHRDTVRTQVQLVTSGGELASLLEQGTSCCTVLTKIQVDITPMVISAITNRIYGLFEGHMDAAVSTFITALRSHSFSTKSNAATDGSATALLAYHPIAYSTNEFLTGCNEIRKCAAVCVSPRCLKKACEALLCIVSAVCDVYRTSALEPTEVDNFVAFARVVVDDFVPHCSKAVDTLFETSYVQGAKRDIVAPLMKVLSQCVATSPPMGNSNGAHGASL